MPRPHLSLALMLATFAAAPAALAQAYPTKAPAQAGGWVSPFAPKP